MNQGAGLVLRKCLTVAGSDSGGGAGIEADLKTFAAIGVYGTVAITAVTAQNTQEVRDIHVLPAASVMRQIEAVVEDIGIDAVKIGMLATAEIVEAVAACVRDMDLPRVVIDPVMISKSRNRLLAEDAVDALKRKLFPLAAVITPNLDEAEVLTGRSIGDLSEMMEAAKALCELGPRYVIVKGGHLAGQALYDVLYDGHDCFVFPHCRIDTPNTHGTGCTFSAALASYLALGDDIYIATHNAQRFLRQALAHSLGLGGGAGPTNHLAKLYKESSRYRVWTRFREIVSFLRRTRVRTRRPLHLEFSMAAYPFSCADDICSVPGGVAVSDGYFHIAGAPNFGRSTVEGSALVRLAGQGFPLEGAWLLPPALTDVVQSCGWLRLDRAAGVDLRGDTASVCYEICPETSRICLLGQDATILAGRVTKILNTI